MWIKAKQKLAFALTISCISAAVSGCSLLPAEEEALKPPLFKPLKENYETFEVKRGDIQKQVKGVATFESTKQEFYKFESGGGKLASINVKAGDMVKKGDLLVQLELEGIDLEIKQRQLDVEKVKVALDDAKGQQDVRQMKIKMLELDIAQIQLDNVLKKKAAKEMRATMDGQVIFTDDSKPGDYIDSDRKLIVIADTSQLRLSYSSESNNLGDVTVGMSVEIEFDKNKYTGKVVQAPSSAPFTENRELMEKYSKTAYFTMDKIPDKAEIGKFADITIVTQKRTDTLKIPRRGLRAYLGRNYVQVLDGKSVREIDVEKGIESSTEVEITQGLKEGQQVILQ